MPPSPHEDLPRAIAAVQRAARVTRAVQRQIDPGSLEKGDKSPVTTADFASQAVVCETLGTDTPLVGEEDAAELRGGSANFLDRVVTAVAEAGLDADGETVCSWIDRGGHDGSGDRYWTLDPIDGTKGFLRGQQYAISLALIEAGEIVLGVLGCPNLPAEGVGCDRPLEDDVKGILQWAVRGQGAYCQSLTAEGVDQSTQLSASEVTAAKAVRMCESVESGHSSHSHSARIAARLGIEVDPVRLDSQAKYALVARGDAEAYLRLPTRPGYQEKIWDHAGGVIVLQEAGGRVSDVEGRPLDFARGSTLAGNRGVIATAAAVHDEVLSTVAAVLAEDSSGHATS